MHGNSSRSNELAACSSDQQRQKQQLCQKSIKKTFGAEKLVIFIPSTTSMTYIRMTVLPIFFWKVVVGRLPLKLMMKHRTTQVLFLVISSMMI